MISLPTRPVQCLNCNAGIRDGDEFCPNCGQKVLTPRLTVHEIGHEFLHAMVHVDRSVIALARMLVLQPGVVSSDYVSGKRRRYYGPFAFLVVAVALTSAVFAVTGFKAVSSDNPGAVVDFLQHHVNLIFFSQVPLLAAFSRLVGIHESFNYAEYLVVAAYTSAMHIVFYSVVVVPVWYFLRSDSALLTRLFFLIIPLGPLYFSFAMYQFLPGRRPSSAFKGLSASLLTQAATYGLVNALANLA
jgi:hypothetical protein